MNEYKIIQKILKLKKYKNFNDNQLFDFKEKIKNLSSTENLLKSYLRIPKKQNFELIKKNSIELKNFENNFNPQKLKNKNNSDFSDDEEKKKKKKIKKLKSEKKKIENEKENDITVKLIITEITHSNKLKSLRKICSPIIKNIPKLNNKFGFLKKIKKKLKKIKKKLKKNKKK
jgi:hypothetical protein